MPDISLKGKTIVLGVTGGIAAYKMPNVAHALVKLGADVHVLMTKNATEFIAPLVFETLTIRYADLENDPSHYAAIKLAEAGVFTGEEIGGTYFLSPNETVSRAQFISMVMAGADAPVPTAAIPSGLADDAATPKWAKAASAAALHAGIVTGSPNGSGSRELRAEDPITRAEAAAILDRAAQLPADQLTEEVFADGGEIPQWAAQAVINATNAGILDTQNGQVRPNDTLTRAEAVQMVYRAFPQEEESGGILDFLK